MFDVAVAAKVKSLQQSALEDEAARRGDKGATDAADEETGGGEQMTPAKSRWKSVRKVVRQRRRFAFWGASADGSMIESFWDAMQVPDFDYAHRYLRLKTENDRWCMTLLLRNKSYGYPNSNGTFWSNWYHYMMNRHPLISIFRAHKLHPFTKGERLLCLFCSTCWSFFTATTMRFVYSEFCGGPMLSECSYVQLILPALVLALLVIPFEIIIRVIVICPCCRESVLKLEGTEQEQEAIKRLEKQIKVGWYVGLSIVFMSLFWIAMGVMSMLQVFSPQEYCDENYDCTADWFHLAAGTVYIKVFALVLWFPQWFIPFAIYYSADKKEFEEKFPGQSCVTVSEEATLEDVQANRASGHFETDIGVTPLRVEVVEGHDALYTSDGELSDLSFSTIAEAGSNTPVRLEESLSLSG